MKLRVLGCSGGIGDGLRTTSLLIDDDILIDAGTGIGELTLEEMAKIRHVFVTHSHLDHIACLPLMVDSIFDQLKQPIIIHAQAPTIEVLKKHIFNWAIWPDFAKLPTPEIPVMAYDVLSPGETCELEGRLLEMIPVNHIVPAVGYRVACDTGVFAFTGDTVTNDTFWAALNAHDRLDLLFVEAAFSNKDRELSLKARHYCPSLLADDLKKLNHTPEVFVTHNKPGEEMRIFDECQELMPERNLKRLLGNQVFEL